MHLTRGITKGTTNYRVRTQGVHLGMFPTLEEAEAALNRHVNPTGKKRESAFSITASPCIFSMCKYLKETKK
jgi:hypothetical protein